MANVAPPGLPQFCDANGNPVALGTLSTFDAGTSTPRTTWSDAAETSPNANPIVLDSAGEAQIFYRGNYKLILKTAGGATVWTVDGFNVPDLASSNGAIQIQVDGSNVGTAGQFTIFNFDKGATVTPSGSSAIISIGDAETVTFGGVVVDQAAGLSVTGGPFSSRGFADNATTAKWNIDSTGRLLNNGNSQPIFFARRITSNQTSGNTCLYNTEDTDQGGIYDPTTGIFAAPVTGWYLITAGVLLSNNATADRSINLRVDGGAMLNGIVVPVINAVTTAGQISWFGKLTSGQHIVMHSVTAFSATYILGFDPGGISGDGSSFYSAILLA